MSAGSRLTRVASLATLGALTGLHLGATEAMFAGAGAALILGEFAIVLLRALLHAGNGSVRAEHGTQVVRAAVDEGLLMLLPFAALALLAELGFGWESVQAFAAAGLLTAASLAGSTLTAKGGSAVYNALAPMAVMLPTVAAWAMLAALAAGAAP
ncbi:MAG: hypothetical protein AB7E72_14075 [Lysobacterales bacterium]